MPLFGQRRLDALKPPDEFPVCRPQRRVGIDPEVPRDVRHHEQQVAELFSDTRGGVVRRAICYSNWGDSDCGVEGLGLEEQGVKVDRVSRCS